MQAKARVREGARGTGEEKERVFLAVARAKKNKTLSFFSSPLSPSLSTHCQQEDVDGRGEDRPDFREERVQGCFRSWWRCFVIFFKVRKGKREKEREKEEKTRCAFVLSLRLPLSQKPSSLTRILNLVDDAGQDSQRRIQLVAGREPGRVEQQPYSGGEDAGGGRDLLLLVGSVLSSNDDGRRRAARLGLAGRRRRPVTQQRRSRCGAQESTRHLSGSWRSFLVFLLWSRRGSALMKRSRHGGDRGGSRAGEAEKEAEVKSSTMPSSSRRVEEKKWKGGNVPECFFTCFLRVALPLSRDDIRRRSLVLS